MPTLDVTGPTDAFAVLLAGGRGARLHELTAQECKPALPFLANARIVDFAMANVARAGVPRLLVATQYRPATLERHLRARWGRLFGRRLIIRDGADAPGGYGGTAGAVAANRAVIDLAAPREVVVLAADHICGLDLLAMITAHRKAGRPATVAVEMVPRATASAFGVLSADAAGRITAFVEKPADPDPAPGRPDMALASMGIYVFDWRWLRGVLDRDAAQPGAPLDFGHDVLPAAVAGGAATAWRPSAPNGGPVYWRDVGTLDAYRLAHLDFVGEQAPCATLDDLSPFRQGGRTARGGTLAARRWTLECASVLMPGAVVEPGARLTRAILAPGAVAGGGLVVGEDADEDARWFRRTPEGTTLVTSAMLARRAAIRTRPTIVSSPRRGAPSC